MLPPRAVVIATTPHWLFRHWEHAAVEAVRPDVAVVPVPYLHYPGTADAFLARHPSLRDLVERYLARDRLDEAALSRLAARQPVLVELDMRADPSLYASLVPERLLHRVAGAQDAAAYTAGVASQRAAYRALYAQLGADVREKETSRVLLWLHYLDALYYAARGEIASAREATDRATALHPADAHLAALRDALARVAPGVAIDVRPLLHAGAFPAAR
jgi:hypothetical protein